MTTTTRSPSDPVQTILFESPIWLGVVCFALFSIVLLARMRLEDRVRRYALPGVLLLTALLCVLQWAIVTERERILNALDRFVSAIAAEDTPGWSGLIAGGYRSGGMDRESVIETLASALERVDVYDTRLRRREVTVSADRAEMILGAVATVRPAGRVGQLHTGRWKIGWVRQGDDWKIDSIRPVVIDTIAFERLDDVVRLLP